MLDVQLHCRRYKILIVKQRKCNRDYLMKVCFVVELCEPKEVNYQHVIPDVTKVFTQIAFSYLIGTSMRVKFSPVSRI